ncbi:MAG: tetratricopeptide repeat protein [Verrucomicrobia bacterium]|nr:tetratricopeptide repeat protein [Verrucomicrobiota bacterium]MDA1069491.1 tetratricopeptide repeat protein [Verrucomicrobiota bacterium]
MKHSLIPKGLFVFMMIVSRSSGHDSPGHVIESLNNRMVEQGATAGLLIDRAFENQSLGNWDAVVEDCLAALEIEPDSRLAIIACTEALLQLDRLDEAESMTRYGIALDGHAQEKTPVYALLARILTRQDHHFEALEAWRAALRSPQPEIDWFLGEAESLGHLLRYKEQVDALSKARERNPSIVLHRAWIRALIDAGDFETALQEIEKGIANTRWKSSWLLLRARIHEQQKRHAEEADDARVALVEIQSRLNTDFPDPYLVKEVDRALAILNKGD